MNNKLLAKILYDIADYLEIDNVAFKPYAYRKVALNLEELKQDVSEIYKEGGLEALEKIEGVGKNIAESIKDYLETGKIDYYEQLKKKIPIKLDELNRIEGLGPRKIKTLYDKLKVKDLKTLESAAKKNKIAPLFGFGEKTEKNILQGIEFLKSRQGRFGIGEVYFEVQELVDKLGKNKFVDRIALAGSLRRRKETIGDADILISSKKPTQVMDYFVSLPGIVKIWAKGNTKSSVRLENGMDVDVRVVPAESFGSALQYFSGSKDHNIALRKIAIKQGLKLSEYGLFRSEKAVAGAKEEDIYNKLGLGWIPPELREDQGEIEMALSGKIIPLLELKDIKGDLHCHSNWDGGADSTWEMAEKAMSLGYQYIGISDHTEFIKIEKSLSGEKLLEQKKEVEKLNLKLKKQKSKFRILQGCETNILSNGKTDIEDEVLAKMDYVIAGIHSSFKMDKEKTTERIIKAMKNPHIDIISHPTGRLINKRDEYKLDMEAVFKTAVETKTILEINSSPMRLDLDDKNIKRAKELGVKMIINTDAHQKEQMDLMMFGVNQARRGWAEKKDIINTLPLEGIIKFFGK